MLHLLIDSLKDRVNYPLSDMSRGLHWLVAWLAGWTRDRGERINAMEAALTGDLALTNVGGDLQTVTAALLNAAAAGTLKLPIKVLLGTAAGDRHRWAAFAPVNTPAEAVTDADVGAPTVDWTSDPGETPLFEEGELALDIIPDTDEGATKTYVAWVKSTGSIVAVVGTLLIDGETFTLEDAEGTTRVFEFDDDAAVTGDNVPVSVWFAGHTDEDIAQRIVTAVNRELELKITATRSGATVTLTQDVAGVAGDTTISETVADAGFVATSFTGGADNDTFSVDIQVASDDKLFAGRTVTKATKTFRVV